MGQRLPTPERCSEIPQQNEHSENVGQFHISEPSDTKNLDTTESEKVATESEKKKSELLVKNDMPKPTPPDTLGEISESLPLQSLPMEFGQNVAERNTEIVEKISPIVGLESIIGSVSLVSSHGKSQCRHNGLCYSQIHRENSFSK
ncbi:hypothetical protein ZOSMA_157G00190 [Zostera marina]|uniref:Uncharacterized protein n=1 Tax=Zostera marina TaxID=29655 RepID=A0A0K9PVA6_ZOSMR|nr:hypothetical protein ZOSMA_157G00190 [Zostera marina]